MKRRVPRVAIVLALALACFAVGVWAGRSGRSSDDLGVRRGKGGEPTVIFDASAIRLLPDAELRLDPIEGFDAAAGRAPPP